MSRIPIDPPARRLGRRDFVRLGLCAAGGAFVAVHAGCGGGSEDAGTAPDPGEAEAPPGGAPAAPEPDAGGAAAGGTPAAAEDTRLVTEIDAVAPTVQSLQYVNESAKPDQQCANCRFFHAEGDGSRGKCDLFPQGRVRAAGWCISWQKLPA